LTQGRLESSRARTKKKELVPTGVMAALQVAYEHLQGDITKTGAEVTADENLPTVMADPTQLWELLQNLISNALKFRGEKPPEVHVGARRRGDRWEISVPDNGIGVDPQYLERIFGLGERLHTAEEYPGSGIGLATCQTIVQKQGGRNWA